MKKLVLSLFIACCAFSFSGYAEVTGSMPQEVTQKSPVSEAIQIFKDATVKINAAQSLDEVEQIGEQIEVRMEAFEEKYSDYEPTEQEAKQIEAAMTKFMEALKAKVAQWEE